MKTILLYWFLFAILSFNTEANARPISYAGGWTIMQMNDFNKHSMHVHFSPSINFSIGYKGEYWRKKEWQFHGAQFNYLIKRINSKKSQTNLYLKNAVGTAFSDHDYYKTKLEPNIFSGISFDWEDRQYFVSYENRINYNKTIDKFFIQKGRLGFAPYQGKYGSLHSWLMFQVEHMPQSKNKIVYTPILRMFKGDYLAEAGLSNLGDITINFIKRF